MQVNLSRLSDLNSKSLAIGKYEVLYSNFQINDSKNRNIKYLKYSGFGGTANCLFSVVVPGLGNSFVNRKKKSSWLITTIGVSGLMIGGLYENTLSSNNYQKYENATSQNDIDSYYNKANTQYQLAYDLIGVGACWWAIDIIDVYIKGSKNKKESDETRRKVNLSFYPSMLNNTLALGINFKF
jgi:hypothetical protein